VQDSRVAALVQFTRQGQDNQQERSIGRQQNCHRYTVRIARRGTPRKESTKGQAPTVLVLERRLKVRKQSVQLLGHLADLIDEEKKRQQKQQSVRTDARRTMLERRET
jgi:hypothetical protein